VTADIILLADYRPPVAPPPAALDAGNAAIAVGTLVTACRALAASLRQISESCHVVRERMNQLHDDAKAAAASAAEVVATTQRFPRFDLPFEEMDNV